LDNEGRREAERDAIGLSTGDMRLVGRGIMVLCVAIAVGVAAVDNQLKA
jgi:hypothetical protein